MNLTLLEIYAKEAIKEFAPAYKFEWWKGNGAWGRTFYQQKLIKMNKKKFIELKPNKRFSNFKHTLYHEIAHAITESGHDKKWKQSCADFGIKPERLHPN